MNLGAASWWTLHREVPAPRLPATERGIATLKLLSETETPPTAEAADELNAAPDALNAATFCTSLGPFQTPADLRHAIVDRAPGT